MPYKMTRETVSVIRFDAAGIAEAEKKGYSLIGKCDQDGNLTGEEISRDELVVKAEPSVAPVIQPVGRGKGRR